MKILTIDVSPLTYTVFTSSGRERFYSEEQLLNYLASLPEDILTTNESIFTKYVEMLTAAAAENAQRAAPLIEPAKTTLEFIKSAKHRKYH